MNIFSNRGLLLLVFLTTSTAQINQECLAKPGDLITHTVTHSTVSTVRVTGWQNQLTSVTPNLGNYYWEPMTKRIINTTRTTSKGATAAAPIVPQHNAQYVKPVHAQMPMLPHPLALTAVTKAMPPRSITTGTKLSYSVSSHPAMTYQDTNLSWSTGHNYDSANGTNAVKENVFGVLKTPISSMRAKAQSL